MRRVDEVENLKRGSGLARDTRFSRFGDTLWSRWTTSRTAFIEAREGRGAERRPTAEGRKTLARQNPKRAPRSVVFNRVTEGGGRLRGSKALKTGCRSVAWQREAGRWQRQEGKGRRKALRLLENEKP